MPAKPARPPVGATVRYWTGGRIHCGIALATPTQHGDDSFAIQDLAPPYGYIQAWPGDPRILPAEDDAHAEGRVPMAETEAERKARVAADAARAAKARAAVKSARRSGHAEEADMFEALAEWVEET